MYQLKHVINPVMLHLSSVNKVVSGVEKHKKNHLVRAITFVLTVILLTGCFCEYFVSSSFAGEPKKAKTKARKAPSGQLRSAPTGDMPLDSYITNVTASGTTKVEENLYQSTLELRFAIDTECIEAVTSAGYKFVYDLPEEVVLNEGLISGGPFFAYLSDRYPELELAFTYDFILTGDGRYRIEIVYDDDMRLKAEPKGSTTF